MPVLLRSEVESLSFSLDPLQNTADELLRLTGHGESELSILLVDDEKIRQLNSTYRAKDKATNVLSFPLFDDDDDSSPTMLGDIVISVDTAAREAKKQGNIFSDYLNILLVHGFVHLLGFDHERDETAARAMSAKEKELLKEISTQKKLRALSE